MFSSKSNPFHVNIIFNKSQDYIEEWENLLNIKIKQYKII